MISARPRVLIKVTFLKHFALEVWVSICLIETSPVYWPLELFYYPATTRLAKASFMKSNLVKI